MTNKKLLSILIPAYQEEKNISWIYNEILKIWKEMEIKFNYEIIFINDGSKDNTWEEITKLSKVDKNVHGINFSRNFGHQSALEAGLKEANGDAIIMMDCDLQHPPSLIPELVEKWEEGFEIVNTKRIDTENISIFKKFSSKIFYWFINKISSTTIEDGSSDFRLLDNKVVIELNKLTEKHKFYRGLVNWIGFKCSTVEFVAGDRIHGKSGYTFNKMLNFARAGITSFSLLPMKIVIIIGFILFVIGFFLTLFMLYYRFFIDPRMFSGTAILASFIILNNGLVVILIGIISLYQINMYQELQNRPSYIIADKI